MHTTDKPEQCDLCDTRFKYKKTLVRHMVQQHGVPRECLNNLVQQRILVQPRDSLDNEPFLDTSGTSGGHTVTSLMPGQLNDQTLL